MHIVHVACAVDAISSILLDLVEAPNLDIAGGTRDQKLETLWHNYRSWAESAGSFVFYEGLFVYSFQGY